MATIGDKNNNLLVGTSADETFKGYGGGDFIVGGGGIDWALYGDSTAGVVVNLATHAGYTGSAAGDTLHGIENLGGSAWNDHLLGDGMANTLHGNGGNDILWGADGQDTLDGGFGDDRLGGGDGLDHLWGGLGDDTYYPDADDILHEQGTQGFDTVVVTEHYTLAEGVDVERLRVEDPASTTWVNLNGNSSGQEIFGTAGINIISGGGGADILTGGGFTDYYHFDFAPGGANLVTITDFGVDDFIWLYAEHFPALPGIGPSNFVNGTAAQDANDRLIYNSGNGHLLYDPDGTGAAPAIHFATLPTGQMISASEFGLLT